MVVFRLSSTAEVLIDDLNNGHGSEQERDDGGCFAQVNVPIRRAVAALLILIGYSCKRRGT